MPAARSTESCEGSGWCSRAAGGRSGTGAGTGSATGARAGWDAPGAGGTGAGGAATDGPGSSAGRWAGGGWFPGQDGEAGEEVTQGGPLLGDLAQAFLDQRAQRVLQPGQVGRLGQDPVGDGRDGLRVEGAAARRRVGEDRAEGEDVAGGPTARPMICSGDM
jgi:hypothetical protein